jgi:hypothetical protein
MTLPKLVLRPVTYFHSIVLKMFLWLNYVYLTLNMTQEHKCLDVNTKLGSNTSPWNYLLFQKWNTKTVSFDFSDMFIILRTKMKFNQFCVAEDNLHTKKYVILRMRVWNQGLFRWVGKARFAIILVARPIIKAKPISSSMLEDWDLSMFCKNITQVQALVCTKCWGTWLCLTYIQSACIGRLLTSK